MNDTEMRELDAWIAEHVIGFQERQAYFGSSKLEGKTFWVCNGITVATVAHKGQHTFPRYSVNYGDAMAVLEKCINRLGWSRIVSFGQTADGNYFVNHSDADPNAESFCNVEAETLPLAICLFAKELYKSVDRT